MADTFDAPLGSATVEVRATIADLKADMIEAKRLVAQSSDEMARSATRAEVALGRVGRQFKTDMRESSVSVAALNAQLGATQRLATAALAGAGSFAAAAAVARLADQYTNLSARIRLVLKDGEDFGDVQERLFNLAQQSRASIVEVTNLYVRMRQAIAGLGDAEAQNIVRTLSQSLIVSGASAQEAASFLRQMSQALASGVLRGDEFNSVMENNSRFARLLADQLGVGVGNLRQMAEQGRLTSDVIRAAITLGGGDVQREFASMPLTIGQAFEQVSNALARYVGQTDVGLGASRRLAQGISLLAENFTQVADALLLVGAAFAGSLAGRGAREGVANFAKLWDEAYTRASTKVLNLQRQQAEIQDNIERATNRRVTAMAKLDEIERDILRTEQVIANTRESLNSGGPTRAGPMGAGQKDGDFVRNARVSLAAAEAHLNSLYIDRLEQTREQEAATRTLSAETGRMANTQAALAQQMRATNIASRSLNAGFATLGRGAAYVVDFLGGPLGVALTAASVAFMIIRSEAEKTQQAMAGFQNALEIAANMQPVLANNANAAGHAADQTGRLADETRRAADASNAFATASRNVAAAQGLQAQAAAGLAEIHRRDTIQTLTQAIAEQPRIIADSQRRIRELQREMDNFTGGDHRGMTPAQIAADNAERARLRQAIEDEQRYVEVTRRGLPVLEQTLEAYRNGIIQTASDQDDANAKAERFVDGLILTAARAHDAARALQELHAAKDLPADFDMAGAEQRIRLAATGVQTVTAKPNPVNELREWLRETHDAEEAMRRAAALGPRAAEAVRAVLEAPESFDDAGKIQDALLRFERTLVRIQQLRAAAGADAQGGGPFAGMFDRATVDAANELSRSVQLGVDAVDALNKAERDGLLSPENAERARQSFSNLGDDYERARRIVESARTELSQTRRELAEIQRLSDAGIFGQIGSENEEGARVVELLENMARAAGDASQALAILNNTALPKGVPRNEAERRIRQAATQGTADREERQGRIIRSSDIRDAAKEGLYDAFAHGNWREAFASVLSNVVNSIMRRASDSFVDWLFDGLSSSGGGGKKGGGGGGFFSSIGSVVASIFGGRRAVGGPVRAGKAYLVGEQGPEPFFPGVDGAVGTNKAMREIVGGGGAQPVKLIVEARIDDGIDMKIAAASDAAANKGALMAVQMVGKSMKNRTSN